MMPRTRAPFVTHHLENGWTVNELMHSCRSISVGHARGGGLMRTSARLYRFPGLKKLNCVHLLGASREDMSSNVAFAIANASPDISSDPVLWDRYKHPETSDWAYRIEMGHYLAEDQLFESLTREVETEIFASIVAGLTSDMAVRA